MNRKDRLRHWTKVLESVKSSQFDMNYWKPDKYECRTACCAAGHAALDPIFKACGFISPSVASVMTFFGLSYDDADWLTCPMTYVSGMRKFKRPGFEQKRVKDVADITPDMVIERINYLIETL